MQFHCRVVRHPDERCNSVDDGIARCLARVGFAVAPAGQPLRRVVGDLLVSEAGAVEAVGTPVGVHQMPGEVGSING